MTWLNDKARPHVEPLARELEAPITGAARRRRARPARGGVRRRSAALGQARHPGAFDRLRAEGGPARRPARLLGRGLRQGDGRLLPFLRPHGQARRAADDRRRHDVRHELLRRQPGGAELQRHGPGQGGARSGVPLPRLRARAARHPRPRHLARPAQDARRLRPEGLRAAAERGGAQGAARRAGRHHGCRLSPAPTSPRRSPTASPAGRSTSMAAPTSSPDRP